MNETVKFLWKYYVKGVDVDIRWGTSKRISSKVSTFDKLFFYATEYEKHKIPRMADDIPERYRGRVQIVGQATLQIVNVTLEDEGEYLCEISDTGESWTTLSRAVKLHVLGKFIFHFTLLSHFFRNTGRTTSRVKDCCDECMQIVNKKSSNHFVETIIAQQIVTKSKNQNKISFSESRMIIENGKGFRIYICSPLSVKHYESCVQVHIRTAIDEQNGLAR